jgi:hypothetical protein
MKTLEHRKDIRLYNLLLGCVIVQCISDFKLMVLIYKPLHSDI